ncbi:GNAT family N-acetyltransferase [Staphylococcus succinus]|jgi:ribosomal protein S18 acetylase RimI-like enzyme|nr:N-acetyltransferase [Staphylococcus succinus]MEB8127236.1 GNAT family N-acetyltransferase [Staphylococcus succinus]MEB8210076.1 GNAT family N-acetyltransferase [Staphylococcus succinus]
MLQVIVKNERSDNMFIRYLNEDDVEQYRALRLTSLKTDPNGFASTYDREIKLPMDVFKSRIASSSEKFTMGAFEHEKLICMATFYSETLEKVQHKGNLVGVYCHVDFRRQGLAQQLIHNIIDIVTQQGKVKTIALSVLSDNYHAIALYEKLGFRRYGIEPKSLFDGNVYYDEDLMCLEL